MRPDHHRPGTTRTGRISTRPDRGSPSARPKPAVWRRLASAQALVAADNDPDAAVQRHPAERVIEDCVYVLRPFMVWRGVNCVPLE
jgi:hypothetical protein